MKTESTLLLLLTLSSIFHVTGCGSGSAAPPRPTLAQAPSIISISPSNAGAGGPPLTLTINGANFASGAEALQQVWGADDWLCGHQRAFCPVHQLCQDQGLAG